MSRTLIPTIPHRPDSPGVAKREVVKEGLLSEVSAVPMVEAPGVNQGETRSVKDRVIEALKTIFDPEIPVSIYELGLIYDVTVDGANVAIQMTLTSPACPVAGSLPGEVEDTVERLPDVDEVMVELTWDPPWTPDKMSEEAKLMLNLPY